MKKSLLWKAWTAFSLVRTIFPWRSVLRLTSPPLEFRAALERILAACREHGKLAFIYANTMAEARACFARGYQGVAVGTDTTFLVRAVRAMLQS